MKHKILAFFLVIAVMHTLLASLAIELGRIERAVASLTRSPGYCA